MKIKDLITDAATGQMSHSKLWSNVGYGSMTYAFVETSMGGGLTDMLLFAYGAVVVGNATASKIVSMRGVVTPQQHTQQTPPSKIDNPD